MLKELINLDDYMTLPLSETIVISSQSDAISASYAAKNFARHLGFNEILQSKIATSASELATNIVKYAVRGYITVSKIKNEQSVGIEVIAEDRGPGIANQEEAMTDYYSSGSTLGLGLPGVKRLMDELLIDSSCDYGTKIIARKWMVDASL